MVTEVINSSPKMAHVRCSYCGNHGHKASDHPDYKEWNARTLAKQRADRRQVLLEQQVQRQIRNLRKLLRRRKPRRPPVEKKCEGCGEVFEHVASASRKYCSRDCYYRTKYGKEWEKAPEPEETKRSARLELEHAPGEGFAMADLEPGDLWSPDSGEVGHSFTLAELEEIHPSTDPSEWTAPIGGYIEWLWEPAALPVVQYRRGKVTVKKTPCRPPP